MIHVAVVFLLLFVLRYTLVVLSALPWVARELYSKKPNDLDKLLSTVDSLHEVDTVKVCDSTAH